MIPETYIRTEVPSKLGQTFTGLAGLAGKCAAYWLSGHLLLIYLDAGSTDGTFDSWSAYALIMLAWVGLCETFGTLGLILIVRPVMWLSLWVFDELYVLWVGRGR